MPIRCAHCKGRHDTVAEVRACSKPKRDIVAGEHDDPCVCGTYDRCKGMRLQDAQRTTTRGEAFREMHRAYND